MSKRRTRGIVAAALTAIDKRGRPCIDLITVHCRRLLDAGCASIVLLGTTGEANSFSLKERMFIVEGVINGGIAPSALIVGTGCCAAQDTGTLTKHALSLGVERVLVLPPFYYKGVGDAGVVDAYSRTIEFINDARLRLYLYQIPQLSGIDLRPAIVKALVEKYPRVVVGIKDSSGQAAAISALCSQFGDRLDVLVGSERYLLTALAAGASGCVTATANAYPELICETFKRRDKAGVLELQRRISAARSVFETFPMIAALKEFVAQRSGDSRWRCVRPPLEALTKQQSKSLFTHLQTLPEFAEGRAAKTL